MNSNMSQKAERTNARNAGLGVQESLGYCVCNARALFFEAIFADVVVVFDRNPLGFLYITEIFLKSRART